MSKDGRHLQGPGVICRARPITHRALYGRYFAHYPIIDGHPLSCMVIGYRWCVDKISVFLIFISEAG